MATHPKKIIGAVRYRCDEPGASSLELTIRLQRQNSAGNWVEVDEERLLVCRVTQLLGVLEATEN